MVSRYPESQRLFFFENDLTGNVLFWSRFKVKPVFDEKIILELGCGHGRLSLDMAVAGAKKVVGIDIDAEKIDFAKRNISLRHPHRQAVLSFQCCEIDALPDDSFDLIVSKDTFEHVSNLPGLLQGIRRCLKPGGRLYAGFGPLYNSPNGYHEWPHGGIPWGHLLIPHKWLLFFHNMFKKERVRSLSDLDQLNQLPFSEYERFFDACGLDVISFSVNQSEHIVSRMMTFLRHVPFLREYCTHNIYCVMEKVCNPT